MRKLKVMSVFGTRPEAVKMCPLVKELEACGEIESIVCLTGQHREMLRQVIELFGTKVNYDLDIMRPEQTLTTIAVQVLERLGPLLELEKPGLVLVHGDTSSSFAAALAAFYRKIPVGHVEAGLRTFRRYAPFPEEINRCLTGRLAELHFAPTENNRRNLETEGIRENVFVTGNTVIDALHTTVRPDYRFRSGELRALSLEGKRCILLTAHRRENLGEPLENICRAAARIAEEFPDVELVYPVHRNPAVVRTVEPLLRGRERVHLTAPLDVEDMHNLIARSFFVMTDSGGLQEEAPSCGVPVLVLRTETERPEAVKAGTVKMAGVGEESIYESARELLTDPAAYAGMANAVNPYGDGHACERIVSRILGWAALQEDIYDQRALSIQGDDTQPDPQRSAGQI